MLDEFRTGLEVTSLVTTVLFWLAVILFESWVVFAEVCFALCFPVLSILWLLFCALFRAWRRTAAYAYEVPVVFEAEPPWLLEAVAV